MDRDPANVPMLAPDTQLVLLTHESHNPNATVVAQQVAALSDRQLDDLQHGQMELDLTVCH